MTCFHLAPLCYSELVDSFTKTTPHEPSVEVPFRLLVPEMPPNGSISFMNCPAPWLVSSVWPDRLLQGCFLLNTHLRWCFFFCFLQIFRECYIMTNVMAWNWGLDHVVFKHSFCGAANDPGHLCMCTYDSFMSLPFANLSDSRTFHMP